MSQLAFTDTQNAFWGVVSTGKGAGVLGHGFLLFKNQDEPFLTGDSYQYTVSINSSKILAAKDIKLTLKEQKFYSLLSFYNYVDDRSIYLYRLNLSPNEITQLLILLNMDLNNPNFGAEHPYGLENNCVGRPVELINRIVGPDRRIEYLANRELIFSHSLNLVKMVSDPFLNHLPFYLARTLEHHPISEGLVKVYDKESLLQTDFLGDALAQMDKLAEKCGWKKPTQKTISLYLALFLKSQSPVDLEPLIGLARTCGAQAGELNRTLVDLYEGLPPDANEGRKTLYEKLKEVNQ